MQLKSKFAIGLFVVFLISITIALSLFAAAKSQVDDSDADTSIDINMWLFGIFAIILCVVFIMFLVCHRRSNDFYVRGSYNLMPSSVTGLVSKPSTTHSYVFWILFAALFIYGISGSLWSWNKARNHVDKAGEAGVDVKNTNTLLFTGMIFEMITVVIVLPLVAFLLWRCIVGTGAFTETLTSVGNKAGDAKSYVSGKITSSMAPTTIDLTKQSSRPMTAQQSRKYSGMGSTSYKQNITDVINNS